MADGELTNKQRVWLEEYLKTWNATEAARRAGYDGDYDTLKSIGSENLTKPYLAAAIKERLAEKAMAADEVLARLGDQARGTMEDFFYIGPKGKVTIDLAKAARAGKLHLLHRYSKGKGGMVSFELYDAQAALVQIAKLLGLYPKESLDVNVNDVDTTLEQLIAAVAAKRKAQDDRAAPPGVEGTGL